MESITECVYDDLIAACDCYIFMIPFERVVETQGKRTTELVGEDGKLPYRF